MNKACLNLLHEGHPGIVKMKLRAQPSVYRIGFNKEIYDYILRCKPCQINSKSQSKEPVIPIEILNRPWQKLGADLFFQGGKWYLLICDYYSKFPVVHGLTATSSKDVISALSSSFHCSVFQRRSSLKMVISLQPRSTRILQQDMVSESQLAVLTTPEDMDTSSIRSRPSSTYSLSVLRMAQTLICLCYS